MAFIVQSCFRPSPAQQRLRPLASRKPHNKVPARALSIEPLRRKISIVGQCRLLIITLFPAVICSLRNDDSQICGACEHTSITVSRPYSYSESRALPLQKTLHGIVSGAVLEGGVFAQNLKDWNCGLYITVKARPSWRNGQKEEQNDYLSSFSPLSRRRKGFGSLLLAFPGLYAWLALLIASDADENICLLHNTRNSVPPFVYASNATATRSYPLAIALRFF